MRRYGRAARWRRGPGRRVTLRRPPTHPQWRRRTLGGLCDGAMECAPLHLVTAEVLVAAGKAVDAFVTYDVRHAAAVRDSDIPVEMPGRG